MDELAEQLGVSPAQIRKVVQTDPKNRFTIRNGHIRANYGHSISVGSTMLADRPPASMADLPSTLFHGTAPRNIPSITEEGLQSKGRQMVHLSTSLEAARRVGARHAANPRILKVNVQNALDSDVKMWKAGPETVLSTAIPPNCISSADD